MLKKCIFSALALMGALAAAPVVAQDWEGLYLGGTLGYGFNGDDDFGLRRSGRQMGDVGKLDVSGGQFGLHIGYSWQADGWVFGPELGYQKSSVSDNIKGTVAGMSYEASSKVKDLLALRMKAGFLTNRDLLIYGQMGLARGKVNYSLDALSANYTASGYTAGVGFEQRLDENWSITGDYEYVNLGKKEREFNAFITQATPSYSSVKLGLNYRF